MLHLLKIKDLLGIQPLVKLPKILSIINLSQVGIKMFLLILYHINIKIFVKFR